MFRLNCTKKLLDRIKPEIVEPWPSDTALGSWYATACLWKPQVALLVSEPTMLPVLMPLAPAATLARRFPARSEEHTSELQSLMLIPNAVFCLKKIKVIRILL